MELQGTLCKGLGEAAGFTRLEWVMNECREKLGFEPHPGTLNLDLGGAAWTAARTRMLQTAGIAIDPPPGFCAAKCFAVRLNGQVDGYALLPEVPGYPADRLEIIAPVFLRQELKLQDGDRVALRIDIK